MNVSGIIEETWKHHPGYSVMRFTYNLQLRYNAKIVVYPLLLSHVKYRPKVTSMWMVIH